MADKNLYPSYVQDVGGRFPMLNTRRAVPVWLKNSRYIFPVMGVYMAYTWYLLRVNSIEFTYVLPGA